MQWNHMKSFKFTTFDDLETKFKALVIIQWKKLKIGQFLSAQRAFEKKQLFLGHSVDMVTIRRNLVTFCSTSGIFVKMDRKAF